MTPALLSLVLALAGPAVAAPWPPPAKTGMCGWVHGRYAVYNGSGIRRIWVIGTHRIIAAPDAVPNSSFPAPLRRYMATAHDGGLADALFGDFRVCAVENHRAGRMQHVRIVGARHLVWRGKPFR